MGIPLEHSGSIRIDVHYWYHHVDPRPSTDGGPTATQAQMDRIEKKLDGLTKGGVTEMAAIDDLRAEVEQSRSVQASVIALVNGLSTKLQEAIDNDDEDELQAIVNDLKTQDSAYADLVLANTPTAMGNRETVGGGTVTDGGVPGGAPVDPNAPGPEITPPAPEGGTTPTPEGLGGTPTEGNPAAPTEGGETPQGLGGQPV